MQNTTKFKASEAQVRAAFKAAGIGEIGEIKELSDGWFNRIYQAKGESGQKYVIKFAPPKDAPVLTHEKNLMVAEVAFYGLIKEKTGIKTPEVVFADFSENTVPTAYFIMEFLEGTRLDKAKLTPCDRQKIDDKLGWILSELHKIEGGGFGYEQVGLKDNWKDGLKLMVEILVDNCAAYRKHCKSGEKLLAYIEKFSAALENVPCVLVDFDLHSMNVFYNKTREGEVELAVLDLERCFWGDSVGDFVMQQMGTPLSKKSIIKHYNKYAKTPITIVTDGKAPIATGLNEKSNILMSENEEIRLQLMRAYLAVIMYTERFSRFNSCGKFFSLAYWAGTFGSIGLAVSSFRKLKKMAKKIEHRSKVKHQFKN